MTNSAVRRASKASLDGDILDYLSVHNITSLNGNFNHYSRQVMSKK